MEKQKKGAMIRFTGILLAVSAILLCASPCSALIIEGPVTIPSDEYSGPINDDVVVEFGGTLNLLDGSVINGYVSIEGGGTLNIDGGYVRDDVCITNGSEVNIKGGSIGGDVFWDITVEAEANVTVFGTDFSVSVEDGEIDSDSSGTYLTPLGLFCLLTGKYVGDAGDIELLFYVWSLDVRIYLAPPELGMTIDIKPDSDQNSINLKSKGVVPVAILTTDNFDVATVDPTTALFAGASPVRWRLEDVDDDGDDDLIFHFRTQELDLDPDSTEATLTALLLTQEEVSGTDEVRIVPSKK